MQLVGCLNYWSYMDIKLSGYLPWWAWRQMKNNANKRPRFYGSNLSDIRDHNYETMSFLVTIYVHKLIGPLWLFLVSPALWPRSDYSGTTKCQQNTDWWLRGGNCGITKSGGSPYRKGDMRVSSQLIVEITLSAKYEITVCKFFSTDETF